jgi:hypothetical protein
MFTVGKRGRRRCASRSPKRRATTPPRSSSWRRSNPRCAAGRWPRRGASSKPRACEPTTVAGDLLFDVSEEVSRELLRLGVVGSKALPTKQPASRSTSPPTATPACAPPATPTARPGRSTTCCADERVFEKLDADYVMPDAKRRAEKNALSGSPNGTSGGDAGQRLLQLSCQAANAGPLRTVPVQVHALQTDEGEGVWHALIACQRQLRTAGMAGVPIGLDFGAVMMVAAAQGADLELLSDPARLRSDRRRRPGRR